MKIGTAHVRDAPVVRLNSDDEVSWAFSGSIREANYVFGERSLLSIGFQGVLVTLELYVDRFYLA
jgi:hypothetical protein